MIDRYRISFCALGLILALATGLRCSSTDIVALDRDAATLNVVRPFGDSITFGVGFSPLAQGLIPMANSAGGGYRGWLTYMFFAGSGFAFSTTGLLTAGSNYQQATSNTYWHDGYPGWRNDQLTAIAGLNTAAPATITLVHAGTNDFLQNAKADEAAQRLTVLLTTLRAKNPQSRLYVAQIILLNSKYGNGPPGSTAGNYQQINSRIADYNQNYVPRIAASVTPPAVVAPVVQALTTDADYIGDGIHPSCQGYLKMACAWFGPATGKPLPSTCSGLGFTQAVATVCPSTEPAPVEFLPR